MIEFVTKEPKKSTVKVQMKLWVNELGSATLSLKGTGDWVDIVFITDTGKSIFASISGKEQKSLPGIHFKNNEITVI